MAKTLTLGEIARVESITGFSYGDDNAPKGKMLAALVLVLKKRTNPDFTLDMAWDMDVEDAEAVITEYFGPVEDSDVA